VQYAAAPTTSACSPSTVSPAPRTLKVERLCHRRYLSREEATQDVFQSIEVFYHRQRRHSTLGYRSPAELEAMQEIA
jgi:putative transposase